MHTPTRLSGTCVLFALAVFTPGGGCRRRARADAAVDGGERFRVPPVLPAPGTAAPDRRSIDAPLAWIFAVESPAPTGSAPDVVVGAELPCGYQPEFGNVFPEAGRLGVRLRVRYSGAGAPDLARPCPVHPVVALPISLGIVRLGDYVVGDATPHGVNDPPAPEVALAVVRDDAATPAITLRRVRRCTPERDADCSAGGVCGALPGSPAVGVCVPPLDPFLSVGRACPRSTAEIHLGRATPFAVRAAPEPGSLRACLPACDAEHRCAAGQICAPGTAGAVCVPG